jgi:tripartite-type tricarboxylate transporter receptor subunit TctC
MKHLTRAIAFGMAATALGAIAQTHAYPDQPITLVIPFSAGGDADLAARALAMVAQKAMGQSLIPVNAAAGAHRLAGRSASAAADDWLQVERLHLPRTARAQSVCMRHARGFADPIDGRFG